MDNVNRSLQIKLEDLNINLSVLEKSNSSICVIYTFFIFKLTLI